jgi:hypothetical protein
MSRSHTASEISQLKSQLKAANRQSDLRLLKLVLVLVILAVIAGFMYGKIHLF